MTFDLFLVFVFAGSRAQLVNTLRQTMLSLENNIQSAFMHVNWPQLRKPWITAVSSCVNARDFARAIIVLQACIKPVVYAPVWSDQLGKSIDFIFITVYNTMARIVHLSFSTF